MPSNIKGRRMPPGPLMGHKRSPYVRTERKRFLPVIQGGNIGVRVQKLACLASLALDLGKPEFSPWEEYLSTSKWKECKGWSQVPPRSKVQLRSTLAPPFMLSFSSSFTQKCRLTFYPHVLETQLSPLCSFSPLPPGKWKQQRMLNKKKT